MPRSMYLHWFTAIATLFAASPCFSATLNVVAVASNLQVPAGGSDETVIGLLNAGVDDISLAVWQVGLLSEPDPGAIGSVEVTAFSTPDHYLFTSIPSFGVGLAFGAEVPGYSPIFSDALVTPSGASILTGETAYLVSIKVSASADAKGTFRLTLPILTGEFSDSYWIDGVTFEQMPFSNNGENDPTRTLVTIEIAPEPATGAGGLTCLFFIALRSRRRRTVKPRVD